MPSKWDGKSRDVDDGVGQPTIRGQEAQDISMHVNRSGLWSCLCRTGLFEEESFQRKPLES